MSLWATGQQFLNTLSICISIAGYRKFPNIFFSTTGPKFHSFSLHGQPFSRYWPFSEESALNDPQMNLNLTRSQVMHICVTTIPDSQIPHRSALWRAISRDRAFETRALNEPINDLEHYTVTGSQCMCY